jgi:16S rRNA (uracil1498-N3)-methyltransferase
MPSFYVPHLGKDSHTITIIGAEHHHIVHVFRRQEGDEITLSSGDGLLANAKIIEIGKKSLVAEIIEISNPKKSNPEISVAIPLLKNKHDNLIVEKLTELGVKKFYPITTERTVRKGGGNVAEKFQKVAVAAIKQCDNAYLPEISDCINLEELLEKIPENVIPVAALEVGRHKLINQVVSPEQSVCIIIGPEGGFSSKEIEMMKQKEVKTISLGNHILRAETAAITAVSQLLTVYLEADPYYY